jgi:chromate reductase
MTTNEEPTVEHPTTEYKVVAISGSLRARSYNTAALRAAAELAPEGMDIEIFDLNGIPLLNPDDEASGTPLRVRELREAIAEADALLISTPEYNYSITAALKNAIDWASRGPDSPLDRKVVAILGVGGRFGSIRAQLHLREILGHNDMRIVGSPTVAIDRGSQKFDADLRLVDDRHRDQITRLLDALAGLIRREHAALSPIG